jgi:hypothetical protein
MEIGMGKKVEVLFPELNLSQPLWNREDLKERYIEVKRDTSKLTRPRPYIKFRDVKPYVP